MNTLILRDDLFLQHATGSGHPERPERLAAVHASLDASPVDGTTSRSPRAASDAELQRVHGRAHCARVAATRGGPLQNLDADTVAGPRSDEVARLAAGAVVQGVEAVVDGAARGAFALVRPPGHHAEPERAMGFCLYNNVAVAAEHALQQGGLSRVLIVDPDVHHGNGIQDAFAERDDVLYISSHRFPFYPGTGAAPETGTAAGRGYTVNLPLDGGIDDIHLLHVWREIADPVVRAFEPELVLVSAGFDTWHRDPLGGMAVTERGFAALFALFRSWSDRFCPGRLVAALEGGYDPAGVVAGVRAGLDVLTAEAAPDVPLEGQAGAAARHTVAQARAAPSLLPRDRCSLPCAPALAAARTVTSGDRPCSPTRSTSTSTATTCSSSRSPSTLRRPWLPKRAP